MSSFLLRAMGSTPWLCVGRGYHLIFSFTDKRCLPHVPLIVDTRSLHSRPKSHLGHHFVEVDDLGSSDSLVDVHL